MIQVSGSNILNELIVYSMHERTVRTKHVLYPPGEFLNVVKGKEVPWRILVDKNTNAETLESSENQAQTKLCLLFSCVRALSCHRVVRVKDLPGVVILPPICHSAYVDFLSPSHAWSIHTSYILCFISPHCYLHMLFTSLL